MDWLGVGRVAFPMDRYLEHFPDGIPVLHMEMTRPNDTRMLHPGTTEAQREEHFEKFVSFAGEDGKFTANEFQHAVDYYVQLARDSGEDKTHWTLQGKSAKEQKFLLEGGPQGELATITAVFGTWDGARQFVTIEDVRKLWIENDFPDGYLDRRVPTKGDIGCSDLNMGTKFVCMNYFSHGMCNYGDSRQTIDALWTPEKDEDATYKIRVEVIRLFGYLGFWFTVALGMLLTRTIPGFNLDDTILKRVFGFNNICIYFDLAPSTYVLPAVWAMTLTIWMFYFAGWYLRINASRAAGNLSAFHHRVLRNMILFVVIAFIYFSTIFAVSPEALPLKGPTGLPIIVNGTELTDEGYNKLIYIHTTPFFVLQFAIFILALANIIDGNKSGYWKRLELPDFFRPASIVYVSLLICVVIFKVVWATNSMLGPEGSPDRFYPNPPDSMKSFARFMDSMFLLFAALLPMFKVLYLIFTRWDKLEYLELATKVGNRTEASTKVENTV